MAPWEKYGGPPAAQTQPAPQAPGIIQGRPKAPSPVEQERLRMEAERLDLARQDQARQNQQGDLTARNTLLDIEKKERAVDIGPSAEAAEAERKAAGFLDRALNADGNFTAIDFDPNKPGVQGVEPRSGFGQFLADNVPNALNNLPNDIGNSSERQLADQAQREFIAAILRYDSGAAIPDPEYVTAARIYFPMPGDDPAVIAQKAKAREVAINGLRKAAGRMAPQGEPVSESLPRVAGQFATAVLPSSAPGSTDPDGAARAGMQAGENYRPDRDEIALGMDLPGTQGSDITGGRLLPKNEAAWAAFIAASQGDPSFSQAKADAFLRSLGEQGGLTLDSEFIDAVRKGESVPTGIDYSGADEARKRAALEASYEIVPEGGDASRYGLDKGLSLNLSDELMGLGGGINAAINGGNFSEGYERERDIERALQARSREGAGIAPEVVGGFLTPGGVFGKAENLGQFARQGAAFGGVAGFGAGEGAADSTLKAGGGAALGGMIGSGVYGAQNALGALARTQTGQRVTSGIANAVNSRRPQVNRDVVEAGQRQNIPIRQPDARPDTRNAMAAVEASPTQGPRVRNVLEADKAAVQGRLSEVGGDGRALDDFGVGSAVQGAGQRYIAKSGAQANRLYRRAEEAAGDARVNPQQALKAIDDNIAELSVRPKTNAGQIKYLEDLKSDLSGGKLSIEHLRGMRTDMRGQINERNLTATDAERRVGQVIKAASADIERGLANNPKALQAYKAADRFYQEKQTFIKDVVQRFTGSRNAPLSPEQASTRFQAMMRNKGDYKRFSEMLKRLDNDERADLAATVAEGIGKARNGEFSLAALATNVEKMSPRAIRDLFGEDGAKAIADLRIIARAKADTLGGLNNSKSGVVGAANNQFRDLIMGAMGGSMAGVPGAMGGMAARGAVERFSSARAARLLLNPDFTRWLRQTPSSTSPQVINRHFDRLNKIAYSNPTFRMDAQALQDYLRAANSASPARAAAEGQQEDN